MASLPPSGSAWALQLSPDRLSITRENGTGLVDIKFDLGTDLIDPVGQQVAHISIGHHINVPNWPDFWKLKGDCWACLTPRDVGFSLVKRTNSFDIYENSELWTVIRTLQDIVLKYHVVDEDVPEELEGYIPTPHVTFVPLGV